MLRGILFCLLALGTCIELVLGGTCANTQYLEFGSCQICNAGMYCNGDYEQACPPGTYCPTGRSVPVPCPGGTYSTSSMARTSSACQPWATCTGGTYESTTPSTTVNRGCTACRVCGAGTQQGSPCGTSSDAVCEDCIDSWSLAGSSCTACTLCIPGESEVQPCSAVADTTCEPCPDGTWTDYWNISRCGNCTAGKG
jgi:hypothetical protein